MYYLIYIYSGWYNYILGFKSTKAEYVAMTKAAKEMIWLHSFLDELGKK